jgi:hypothetical protein
MIFTRDATTTGVEIGKNAVKPFRFNIPVKLIVPLRDSLTNIIDKSVGLGAVEQKNNTVIE